MMASLQQFFKQQSCLDLPSDLSENSANYLSSDKLCDSDIDAVTYYSRNQVGHDDITDTIVAQATAVGTGGIGIVRVSGNKSVVENITRQILNILPKPRYAYYGNFFDANKNIIDKGIALYFKAPNSYTGEEILELHCHGGAVVIKKIISEVMMHGARLAKPGEFTKRAWVNGKMDLLQVEAVCDLINAATDAAATSAANTLSGHFSEIINKFLHELIYLRTFVEASIDFSDEQIDFISIGKVEDKINLLDDQLVNIIATASQGVILREGVKVVIAGKPNAGKSTLLNALCKKEEAIVTEIQGTTRDLIKVNISVQGVPVLLIDTAGIRDSDDLVEQHGIKKTFEIVRQADLLLLIIDGSMEDNLCLINNIYNFINTNDCFELNKTITNIVKNMFVKNEKNKTQEPDFDKILDNLLAQGRVVLLINKADLLSQSIFVGNTNDVIFVSAKNNTGLEQLEDLILHKIGFKQTNEGNFIARSRHLESLKHVHNSLLNAKQLLSSGCNQDLIAEELKLAQQYLGDITGDYTSDELLGNIFSSFCIGK